MYNRESKSYGPATESSVVRSLFITSFVYEKEGEFIRGMDIGKHKVERNG